MEFLSPTHCPVKLQFNHPDFGILKIDFIQRDYDDLKELAPGKKIIWQGSHLKIEEVVSLVGEKNPYGGPAYYIITVKEPARKTRSKRKSETKARSSVTRKR